METTELIEIISRGEDSQHQFKADITNADQLAAELIAFSNSGGGRIFIGVTDQNSVAGLTQTSTARINLLLSNTASEKVLPPVNVLTENVSHPNGTVMVVSVCEGINKPYMDKKGIIWVKNGADKRRATSREEIQRMFQQSGLVHADETPVHGVGTADLDIAYFERFYEENFGEKLVSQNIPLPQLLENMNLARNGVLNVAGTLLFSRKPGFYLPAFIVKAVAFPGTQIEDERYIDNRDITGKLADVFQQTISFIMANIGTRQDSQTINSTGKPEIPRIVWEELVTNALIHRDYFISAPVRIFVFLDRVEIISPGHLPNNLTIANIRSGNSNIRNPILASFAAKKLLPYRGLGSGVLRALKAHPSIDFIDDRDGNLFKAIIRRD